MIREDRDVTLLKQHVGQLMEHFDSVRIFATRVNGTDQETAAVNSGDGNWYAQYGQVSEWIVEQNERAKVHIRKKDEAEDD